MGAKTLRKIVMLGVPAVIALLMAITSVYLMVWTDKEIPAFLRRP